MFVLILPYFVGLATAGWTTPKIPAEKYKGNWTDLLQALNTSELFWRMKRNYSLDRTDCNSWLKRAISLTDYDYFERSRKRGSVWLQQKLVGTLANQTYGPTMTSRIENTTGPLVTYQLRFWSWSEKCGVFTSTGDRCEQRAWNSRVTSSNPDCEEAYYSICGSTGIPSYKQSCINPNAICLGFPSRC
uniref:Putative group i salivary lipocalin n=1 Tax=Rhipicephalus pulchellus TaxID=72859 RepID=L7LT73_RHIPC